MPIYEYQCKAKGHRFEVIQKISDAPLKKCKECGAPVEKLVSASAFVLKGSGFYVNDYAKKDAGGKKNGAGKATDKEPASDAKPKADAAPETSPDKKASACASSTCSA